MYGAYMYIYTVPTFAAKSQPKIGKYTSPMHAVGYIYIYIYYMYTSLISYKSFKQKQHPFIPITYVSPQPLATVVEVSYLGQ